MRRLLHTLTIAAIALSLAGCSSGPAQQPTTTPSSSTAQPSTPENEVAGQSAKKLSSRMPPSTEMLHSHRVVAPSSRIQTSTATFQSTTLAISPSSTTLSTAMWNASSATLTVHGTASPETSPVTVRNCAEHTPHHAVPSGGAGASPPRVWIRTPSSLKMLMTCVGLFPAALIA